MDQPHLEINLPRLRASRRRAGVTIVEIVTAMAVTAVIAAGAIASLLTSQTYAARARLLTNARVLVQRNIDTALGVGYTSVDTPPILELTSGSVYSDQDGVSGDSIPVAINGEGDTIVTGTLTRIVTNLPNNQKPSDAQNSVIRRVTFRIEYTYLNRPYQYEMTTFRAQDDQSQ